MNPLLYALAAGVGVYAGAKRVARVAHQLGKVAGRLAEPEDEAPRLVGTLEADPVTGVYRVREDSGARD